MGKRGSWNGRGIWWKVPLKWEDSMSGCRFFWSIFGRCQCCHLDLWNAASFPAGPGRSQQVSAGPSRSQQVPAALQMLQGKALGACTKQSERKGPGMCEPHNDPCVSFRDYSFLGPTAAFLAVTTSKTKCPPPPTHTHTTLYKMQTLIAFHTKESPLRVFRSQPRAVSDGCDALRPQNTWKMGMLYVQVQTVSSGHQTILRWVWKGTVRWKVCSRWKAWRTEVRNHERIQSLARRGNGNHSCFCLSSTWEHPRKTRVCVLAPRMPRDLQRAWRIYPACPQPLNWLQHLRPNVHWKDLGNLEKKLFFKSVFKASESNWSRKNLWSIIQK